MKSLEQLVALNNFVKLNSYILIYINKRQYGKDRKFRKGNFR